MAEGSEAHGVDSTLLCTISNKRVQNSNVDLKSVAVYLNNWDNAFPGIANALHGQTMFYYIQFVETSHNLIAYKF